jgi:catechol 2,3-dioxygenase-like lactoylglutathione lyase family enzyme
MKLNHLNLTVTDPVATQEFLTTYFGLKPRGKSNQKMAILADDKGNGPRPAKNRVLPSAATTPLAIGTTSIFP